MIIDGKKIAQDILGRLKKERKPKKFLAAVLAGNNPASLSFLRQKEKDAKVLGVEFTLTELGEEATEEDVKKELARLAKDKDCGGIILQLPLPSHLNRDALIGAIPPEKDVDNLTGRAPILSPAVGVLEEIIKNLKFKIKNLRVTVVGANGFLVGKPVAEYLRDKVKDLILIDLGDDLSLIKNADIVITGVGHAGLIKSEMLKDGTLVIDFGYDSGKGDFDSSSLYPIPRTSFESEVLRADGLNPISYTPAPGGTGPILVAKLLENFYILNK